MNKITIIIEDDEGSRQNIKPNIGWPTPQPSFQRYPWERQQQSYFGNELTDRCDVCANCPNNKKNGGSGICSCVIPSLYGQDKVTC